MRLNTAEKCRACYNGAMFFSRKSFIGCILILAIQSQLAHSGCKEYFDQLNQRQLDELKRVVDENQFETLRNSNDYFDIFGATLTDGIRGGYWIDAGAGSALAQTEIQTGSRFTVSIPVNLPWGPADKTEYLHAETSVKRFFETGDNPLINLTKDVRPLRTVAIGIKKPLAAALLEKWISQATIKGNHQYLELPLLDVNPATHGGASVLTDLLGPASYDAQGPFQSIRHSLELLRDGGRYLLAIPSKWERVSTLLHVIRPHAEYDELVSISWFDDYLESWLYSAGELSRRQYARDNDTFTVFDLRVDRSRLSTLKIPNLSIELHEAGRPPVRTFTTLPISTIKSR